MKETPLDYNYYVYLKTVIDKSQKLLDTIPPDIKRQYERMEQGLPFTVEEYLDILKNIKTASNLIEKTKWHLQLASIGDQIDDLKKEALKNNNVYDKCPDMYYHYVSSINKVIQVLDENGFVAADDKNNIILFDSFQEWMKAVADCKYKVNSINLKEQVFKIEDVLTDGVDPTSVIFYAFGYYYRYDLEEFTASEVYSKEKVTVEWKDCKSANELTEDMLQDREAVKQILEELDEY